MFGEDNVLLGQINAFSVISSTQNSIIATANTQHLFRLLSEGGKKFIEEMRENSKQKQESNIRDYVLNQMPRGSLTKKAAEKRRGSQLSEEGSDV